ncbi:MAG: DEAD/DEAH box helicase family protein [Novosphingobium sp.]|nr:DEAD/DEAH box helicase family protein [Novosphingobium sp.]
MTTTVLPALLQRMRFSGAWRDYQQRVLDEFADHAADRRIHVVAAPGSGKTVLGLELVRRIGHPALVLAPTRTIRDQWSARLVPLFLDQPPAPGEFSRDLSAPAALTCTTYQALHAHWADADGTRFAALVAALNAAGPVTLVLDEAHHLRREWWSALQALTAALPDATVIALTATPPYDAPGAEWARYEGMCGPIDLEIGAPELVRAGDLAPHQDHVVLASPGRDALDLLDARRAGIAGLLTALQQDAVLLDHLAGHPWLISPADHVEALLEAPELLTATLVLLASAGRPFPTAPLKLLGVGRAELPDLSPWWLEVLLNGWLFSHAEVMAIGAERTRLLRARLSEAGLIEGGRVRLGESRRIFKAMAGSLAKLDSIVAIARSEAAALGERLRLLILSDHVRADELPRAPAADYQPSRLGVVPVFETLRRALGIKLTIGVLTGTLVILPVDLEEDLRRLATEQGLDAGELRLVPLAGCPGHARVEAGGKTGEALVTLVSALFASGAIRILVGTQALLGEGWDAPTVNSLVLASNSAAFMLSNQMRGRAIRLDPADPEKVANIWHLAAVEAPPPGPLHGLANRLDWGALDPGEASSSDWDLLTRRFRAFEGIANHGPPAISSGIERLGLWEAEGLEACNARTLALAADRGTIARRWQQSLGNAATRARVRECASPSQAPHRLSWYDTLGWLAVSGLSGGALAGAAQLRHAGNWASLGTAGMAVAGAAMLASLPKLLLGLRLLWRSGSLEASVRQVGEAVIAGLVAAGALDGFQVWQARVVTRRSASGRVDVLVEGLPRAGERAVLEALAEALGHVRNPRYLLVRRSWLGLHRRTDYHAVPEAIGRQKASAEVFHREWCARVGSARLVYTRSAEGRLILLRARARSFAAGFQRRVDRYSVWE